MLQYYKLIHTKNRFPNIKKDCPDNFTHKRVTIMKISKIEQQILNYLDNNTYQNLRVNSPNIGATTVEISIDLQLDRANLSRILNKLNKLGLIIKKQGRPVLFFSKSAIQKQFQVHFLPSVLQKNQNVTDFISSKSIQNKSFNNTNNPHLLINQNLNPTLFHSFKIARDALSYPPYGLDIIVLGSLGTGKSQFVKLLYNFAVEKNILSNSSLYIEIDCSFLREQSLEKELSLRILNRSEKHFIVLNNFELLTNNNLQMLVNIITRKLELQKLTEENLLKHSYILLTNQNINTISSSMLYKLIPNIVEIPPINLRSIREKMAYIIHLFQVECDSIERPIYLDKNILNCFLMSHYELNVLQMKSEIKASILHNLNNSSSSIQEITFDDLSDRLLNNIPKHFDFVEELNLLYNQFNFKDVYLTPHKISPLFIKICNQEIKSKNSGKEFIKSEPHISPKVRDDVLVAINTRYSDIKNQSVLPLHNLLLNLFQSHPLTGNNNAWFYFLNMINNLIHKTPYRNCVLSDISNFQYNNSTIKDMFVLLIEKYNIELNQTVISYLDSFIDLSRIVLEEQKISVIFLANDERKVLTYYNFAKSMNSHENISQYVLSMVEFEINPTLELSKFKLFVEDHAKSKGTLILSADNYPNKLIQQLQSELPNSLYYSNFSITQLESILSLASQSSKFLFDIEAFLQSDEFENGDNCSDNLLEIITRKILADSLLFLNPQKVSKISFECLKQIVFDYEITLSESLIVQFVTHVSFMIERIRNKVILKHNDSNNYVITNIELFQIIEKNIQPLNRMFDISIPQSEIVYLCEIIKNQGN